MVTVVSASLFSLFSSPPHSDFQLLVLYNLPSCVVTVVPYWVDHQNDCLDPAHRKISSDLKQRLLQVAAHLIVIEALTEFE